jgi:Flp pilus assembly protein TadB
MPNVPVWIVLVPLGAFALVAALVWMANRRKLAIAANDRDVQLALLSKFTTAEQMTEFLASPEGRRFVDQLAKPKGFDPRRQVLDYLTGGLITLFIGIALTLVARLGLTVLAIPGFICIGVGLALLIAACFIYPIAKRLGLVSERSSERP